MRFVAFVLILALPLIAQEPPKTALPARPAAPKTLDDYFPFEVPASVASWNDRATELRQQVLVANGLWPMPAKTPLVPVIHGKIDRAGYTVEKVYFASLPGHYVTGNLYRPKGGLPAKRPAILSPHGHWNAGRFYDAGEVAGQKQIAIKAEDTIEGARYPLQARCAQLARMGFVVFHYDMIGYADSMAIAHREGFKDIQAELRLQSFMGLQTYNSIRALDFLASLPEVDPAKIGVTGASGGGTQTFILCGIDERPAAAFPAVMVSTAMQGGCVCENCSLLRVGTGNVELAALFAPKPLAMSGARDWTIDIERKGLPELKKLYAMLGKPDNVAARCWPEFEHNYNQRAREMMYSWFSKHLLGKNEVVKEQPFVPIPPKDLSVFDATHPRPKDELDAKGVRAYLTEVSDAQMSEMFPKDAASLKAYREMMAVAVRSMVGESATRSPIESESSAQDTSLLRRRSADPIPLTHRMPIGPGSEIAIVISPKGGSGKPLMAKLDPRTFGVLVPDLLQIGKLNTRKESPVNPKYAGFTFGYNRTLAAERIREIVATVDFAKDSFKAKTITLVGEGEFGPLVVAAKLIAGDKVDRIVVDGGNFSFSALQDMNDSRMLPGIVKYGGLPGMLAACAPTEVFLHNVDEKLYAKLPAVWKSANAANQPTIRAKFADETTIAEWLGGKSPKPKQ